MKCLILIAFSFVILSYVEGAAVTHVYPLNPDYPGKCVYEVQKGELLQLDDGERRAVEGRCFSLTCNVKEEKFFLQFVGCGKIIPPQQCKLVENKELLHPHCCPDFVCPWD